MSPVIDSPDPGQTRVLEHASGGVLATGPPGSGKTWLLRERFSRLVESGVPPERIALFALNRRAAREAREAIVHRLARSVPELPVFTVHGFAFRVIGRRFDELGWEEPPEILSAADQYAVVRGMLREERPQDWPSYRRLLDVRGFAQQVADFVLRAQERLVSPEDLDALVDRSGRDAYREIAGFYRRYLDAQRLEGRTDHAGLLRNAVGLLQRDLHDEEAYRHVLVDDYQDATHATEAIVRALGRAADSLVVAADPFGHVFSYRGGSLDPLRRADEALGLGARVELERSYRLDGGATALHALEDPGAPPSEAGDRIEARRFSHPAEEAEAVAAELLRLRIDEDVPWEGLAVILRRYGSYLTTLRHALVRHGIPFVVVAEAADVATEPANRAVIDLLRYAFRPDERPELLERVLASPVGGLEPHLLRGLRREARMRELSPVELVHDTPADALPDDLRPALLAFRNLVGELPGVAERQGPDGAFFWLWSNLPHVKELVASNERARDVDALSALADVLSGFVERRPGATIEDYLETLEAAEFSPDPWIPPEERHPQAVRVVSAHRAHGIEFEVALVPGCLEGEFPSLSHRFPLVDIEALVSPASTPTERAGLRLAEERALFRLAVSRARRRTVLFASESAGSRNPRTPSRFAARLGLGWADGEQAVAPATSRRSLAAQLRRTLATPGAPSADRLGALASLPRLALDAREWWWMREWSDPGGPLYASEILTSYSKLSTLENCALQYLYSAELGLDTERSHYMWVGGLVHDIIDRVQRGDLDRTEEAVLAELNARWRPKVFPNHALERQRYRDVREMLVRWLHDGDTKQLEVVASERWFDFPLDGARIRGRIDAILRDEKGRIRVRDYKTGRYPPNQNTIHEDLQLAAYFLGVRGEDDLHALGRPAWLELAFIAVPSKDGFTMRGFPPPDGFGDRAEETLRGHLQTIREERFAPNPEANCRNCRFQTICPVWPQGAEALS